MNDTMILDLASAENYVERNRNTRWEGWDIVSFNPHPRAHVSVEGVFNRERGRWGYESRVTPDSNGLWTVKAIRRGRK